MTHTTNPALSGEELDLTMLTRQGAAPAQAEPVARPIGWLDGSSVDGGAFMHFSEKGAQRECDEHNAYERTRPDFDESDLRSPEPVYATAPAPAGVAQAALPRVFGVSRDAESSGGKGVLVTFHRALSDDEMRVLHEVLTAPVPVADDTARLDWLNEQPVHFIELDGFSIDVKGSDVRKAIDAAIQASANNTGSEG